MTNDNRGHGRIHRSMRKNYEEVGVEGFYTREASTYRNPHFPGVRRCIFSWLDRWREMELDSIGCQPIMFDLAAGSGEATIAFVDWWTSRQQGPCQTTSDIPLPQDPRVVAADPYTFTAYHQRTSLICAPLSFREVAAGRVPDTASILQSLENPFNESLPSEPLTPDSPFEMIVCSFALHLIEASSELFALLWELSTKSRWLVVLAPHKKPTIKDGWGWVKWNVTSWERCSMNDRQGELLHDRVHCRIYRSVNHRCGSNG